ARLARACALVIPGAGRPPGRRGGRRPRPGSGARARAPSGRREAVPVGMRANPVGNQHDPVVPLSKTPAPQYRMPVSPRVGAVVPSLAKVTFHVIAFTV